MLGPVASPQRGVESPLRLRVAVQILVHRLFNGAGRRVSHALDVSILREVEEAAAGCSFILITDARRKTPLVCSLTGALGHLVFWCFTQLLEQTEPNTLCLLDPPPRNSCFVWSSPRHSLQLLNSNQVAVTLEKSSFHSFFFLSFFETQKKNYSPTTK